MSESQEPVDQLDPALKRLLRLDGPNGPPSPEEPGGRTSMASEPPLGRESAATYVDRLIDAVGGTASLSRLIGVTPRQVARWHRGQNGPSPRNAKVLADLYEVVARGQLLWGDRVVLVDWLTGSNAYLGAASPSDFIRSGRTTDVLVVIEETLSGAYA